jgi:hypothetical protein
MEPQLIVRIDRRMPFAEGHAFPDSGPYECLTGGVTLSVDPDAPSPQRIVDLDKAPRNADGFVECRSDLYILRPADPERGNRRLLFEFCNRGNKRALQFFNDAPHTNTPLALEDAGNGFLMRRGYTIVWAAWQGDVLPGEGRMVFDVPVAADGGRPITGPVRAEFLADEPGIDCYPLSGDTTMRSYPAVSLDPARATLTRRQYASSPRVALSAGAWQFARRERGPKGQSALIPSNGYLYLAACFDPGWIYELIYEARDPLVLGLGYLIGREVGSFLRYESEDSEGNPNPLYEGRSRPEKSYCWGRSQSGRLIREFVYRGFNADAQGRRVFDGAFSHVAGAGRMWLNHRFAQPTRLSGAQHEDHLYYGDSFPFAYGRCTDHLTGRTDAILKRPATDPLIMHTQSSTEYWQRRGSLVHTDTKGGDLAQPETVRVYLWASSQHFSDPLLRAPARGVAQQRENVVVTSPLFRSLLDHLDRWATDGTLPPPSRFPRRADGTLLSMADWRGSFPRIPAVAIPREPNRLPLHDYGPHAEEGFITKDPPEGGAGGEEYAVLVPSTNNDGNEVAGIAMPLVQAPLATYTGWSIRAAGLSPGALAQLSGSTIPFAKTKAEREATGDPRASVEERYPSPHDHVRALIAAARRLVGEGFLLEEDYERMPRTGEWD